MGYGVQTARRGWLEKKDVINTLPVEKLLAALRARPGATVKPGVQSQHASARVKALSRANRAESLAVSCIANQRRFEHHIVFGKAGVHGFTSA